MRRIYFLIASKDISYSTAQYGREEEWIHLPRYYDHILVVALPTAILLNDPCDSSSVVRYPACYRHAARTLSRPLDDTKVLYEVNGLSFCSETIGHDWDIGA